MDKRFVLVSFVNTFTQGIEKSINSFNLSVQPKRTIFTDEPSSARSPVD